tara:strand:- start:790 stop:1077 length:288 start_codon:yes stop_codon:yes gene_type:complete
MNRNSFTKIENAKYVTSRYPLFPAHELDKYIISREGDRLDMLSNEFYETVDNWWIIAQANNLGKGSLLVPAGTQIRIPYNPGTLFDKLSQANKER